MIPQEPAEGVLKINDFGSSKFYLVACQCGNPDDDIRLEIEADDHTVSVHQWTRVKTNWWATPTKFVWLNGVIHRIRLTYELWIKGQLEYESYTLMNSQQAINYARTLTQAVDDVQKYRQAHKQQP